MTAVIKQVALDAVHASKPTEICFGTVTSVSPLKIRISQLLELPSISLLQTSLVKGKIAVGDDVILIRQQGGQRYVVLDKLEVSE